MITRRSPIAFKFKVIGIPAPGGSKSAFALKRRDGSFVRRANGNVAINLVDAGGERNRNWKTVVAIQARQVFKKPLVGALEVRFLFYLTRPNSHFKGNDRARELRVNAPKYHTKKPDALKFARSTEDALTGIAWHDDAANVEVTARKTYSNWSGCEITITALEPQVESQPTFSRLFSEAVSG